MKKRGASAQGVALGTYFILLPYVVISRWGPAGLVTHGDWLRDVLVALSVLWLLFFLLLVSYVVRARRHEVLPGNGAAWLATLLLGALPFLMSSPAAAQPTALATPSVATSAPHRAATALSALDRIPLLLAATRRRARGRATPDDALVHDDELLLRLRWAVGVDIEGTFAVTDAVTTLPLLLDVDPVAVTLVEHHEHALHFAYARPGGALRVADDVDDIDDVVTALHDAGLVVAHDERGVWRYLVERPSPHTLILYDGDTELATELARQVVMVQRRPLATSSEVRVCLLRSQPVVRGMSEPFVATLRRRCVEMVAYLALHHDEAVTGDRLRSRVLIHANVEASKNTLANVASSIRRSLGAHARGPRLAPVTSSGLYRLDDVSCDVSDFFRYVAQSRRDGDPAHWASALGLIHSEPLAGVFKGFEWWQFEGFAAQLQRDGEWAALSLAHHATTQGDFDTAFWALRQGLLLDPFSDPLNDALIAVPRLREFGGNTPRRTQDEPIGPGRAVAMRWSFTRFGDEVSE